MPRCRNQALLLPLLLCAEAQLAWAQDDPPAQKADPQKADQQKAEAQQKADEPQARSRYEIVVTASRQRSTVFDTPRAASVVDREELRTRPPRSAADAMSEEEGVFVLRPTWSMGSPFVRGLGGQQVLLMVDGIRLNNTTTRTGPNGLLTLVDPYVIDSLEVVRGPASALYGSDAIGGVVNVRTRRPAPIAGSEIDLSAGLRGIFSSFDQGGQGSLSASGRWGRYALDAAFSLRRFGDLTGGGDVGQQPFTAYREGQLYLGGGVDLGKGTLVLVYQGGRQYDALRADLSQPGDLLQVPELARDLVYLRYSGDFAAADKTLTATATVSYQRSAEQTARLRVPTDTIDRTENGVDMMGVVATVDSDTGRAGHVTGGVEGYFEWVSSLHQRGQISHGPGGPLALLPEQARYPGGSGAQSVALFLQDEIDLERLAGRGDPRRPGRLRALAGVRLGGNFLHIGRDDRLAQLFPQLGEAGVQEARVEKYAVYAGSLHLRYEPLPGLAASAGFASGYRAPNLADYARLGRESRGFAVPARDLRPEMAYSGEVGLRAALRKFEGSAFYSYTFIDDFLSAVPTMQGGPEPFFSRANMDAARLHALEVAARLHIVGGLSVFATVNYVHGVLDRSATPGDPGGPEPFYKVPPVNGVAAVQLRRPRSTFTFAELSVRWAGPQDRLGTSDLLDERVCLRTVPTCQGTPGFAVLSLRGAARLSRQPLVMVTAAVENLTNATYRYHGSGVYGPGVGAVVSLEANY